VVDIDLAARDRESLIAVLSANSGLPGPRANLALAERFADLGDLPLARELAASDDEYLAMCGVVALTDPAELLPFASDSRWRIREMVARSLQRTAKVRPEMFRATVAEWARSGDPLVQRAAVAAVCEPPLLKDPVNAALAVETCDVVTAAFLRRSDRQSDDERVLRKALGYGWSVAVAAMPHPGLERFVALEALHDPDARWITAENRKKARMKTLF
jgi:hypothetical protein